MKNMSRDVCKKITFLLVYQTVYFVIYHYCYMMSVYLMHYSQVHKSW